MTPYSDPVTFRSARPDDAERIAQLHVDSWRRTYRGMMRDEFLDGGALEDRRLVWRERLDGTVADQFVCVAEHGSTLCGFVCVFAAHDEIWGSYIDNLHVADAYHRRGVGRALMQQVGRWLCDVCPDRGVYLWVMQANANARAFYERLGAAEAGIADLTDPGGGHAPNCRCVWARPHVLAG
jgi:ribosomal protein S18 acetylase RimI-like enzyme